MAMIKMTDGEIYHVLETYEQIAEVIDDDSKVMYLRVGVTSDDGDDDRHCVHQCFMKANILFVMDDVMSENVEY